MKLAIFSPRGESYLDFIDNYMIVSIMHNSNQNYELYHTKSKTTIKSYLGQFI